jgi:putative membrane protein
MVVEDSAVRPAAAGDRIGVTPPLPLTGRARTDMKSGDSQEEAMRFTVTGMVVAVFLFAAATARANDDAKKATLTDVEVQSMARLHHINQMEQDMGKLGGEHAKAAEVKSYAARMVRDHKKSDGQVMSLAKKRGVTLSEPTPKNDAEKKQMEEEMATMTKLRSLEGEEFDREYIAAMVKGHADAVQMVSDARAQAKDPAVISLLKSTLPVIQKHHDEAEKLASKPPRTGASPSKPGTGK